MVVDARPGQLMAVIGVLGSALTLVVLPALIGLSVLAGTGAMWIVAVGIASLVAIVGGAKLAAAILGAARSELGPRERFSSASVD